MSFWLPSAAQSHANGLAVESVDPAADAAIIATMRERMDKIHREQHRPTVGLVLSGGGAKGSAHVGVLKYLQDKEIPVDAIFGTSMGGLVGGLAALGYSPDYLDSILRSQDWGVMLTDRIDRSYYSYQQKMYRETYMLAIPFHYEDADFQSRIDEQVRYGNSTDRGDFGRNSFMSSMPSGYVYGFNVNNLLSSLAVGYEDNMSFADLPIPFFCVAADMVSVKSKNWSDGSIKTAMRSTMSIPGLFKPVRTGGMVLVDGGVRNNFPVDIAKAMGCDIIIGVSLSDKDLTYSQVNNLVDIVNRFITMLGSESMAQNKKAPDVFIKPVLDGYNMLSFNPVAIDTMIHRGYLAAALKEKELDGIKSMMKDAKPYLNSRQATDISHTPVKIYAIEFRGLTNAESRQMHRKIRFKAGSYVDKTEMDRIMSVIEATGCFSTVTYSVLGTEEPYKLVFDCEKGPVHQVGVGLRFDTEEWGAMAFNLGLNAHKLSGVKLDLNAKVGRVQSLEARVAMDLSWLPTLNLDASVSNLSASVTDNKTDPLEEARWGGYRARLYLSNINWRRVDINAGAQYRYAALSPKSSFGKDLFVDYPALTKGAYAGLFANGTLYTFDRSYYPSKGFKLTFGGNYDFFKSGFTDFEPLMTGYFDFNTVVRLGNHFALTPELHLRTVLKYDFQPDTYDYADSRTSILHHNYVGGVIPGRYIEGQIPFIGFGNAYMAGPMVGVGQLGLRYDYRNLFITLTGGVLKEAYAYNTIFSLDGVLPGAGAEIAYVTPVGPLKLLGTWCPRGRSFSEDSGLYISFGFDF